MKTAAPRYGAHPCTALLSTPIGRFVRVSIFSQLNDSADSRTPVTLPHDAMLSLPRSAEHSHGSPGGYFPGGLVEYSKTFRAPEEWRDRSVTLHFQGVDRHAVVCRDADGILVTPTTAWCESRWAAPAFFRDSAPLARPPRSGSTRTRRRPSRGALAIIRPTGPGDITVTVSAEGLYDVPVRLTAAKVSCAGHASACRGPLRDKHSGEPDQLSRRWTASCRRADMAGGRHWRVTSA